MYPGRSGRPAHFGQSNARVEEYLVHGENGWMIERTPEAIAHVLKEITDSKYDIEAMGMNAMKTAGQYDHYTFREKWKSVYEGLR